MENFLRPIWNWRCEENRCVKHKFNPDNIGDAVGLPLCRLRCNENDDIGTLWPKPSSDVQSSNEVVKIDPSKIVFKTDNFKSDSDYWEMARERFLDMQRKKCPTKYSINSGGDELVIEVIAKSNEMS